MPAYQRWGSHPVNRMPPTPPEYQSAYLTPMSAMSGDEMNTFYPAHGYVSRHAHATRDFNDHFHGGSFSSHASQGRSKHLPAQQDFQYAYAPQMGPQFHYGHIAAPILPPIRVPEELPAYASHYAHALPEPQSKEEKPTGGVAQVLDYEMDLMSSFVAEMSQRMYEMLSSGFYLSDVNMMRSVSKNSSPTPQFRKYVSQILSSTRLPSSTIMLGLFYLQERMKIVSRRGQDTSSSGLVYRMLTTCLLLGSKFLDDNTFQNRSWAEVSSIAVGELNTMELDWLKDFNWEIHGLMYDREEGFYKWREHWKSYEEKARQVKVKEMQKLAPIETNFVRTHTSPAQPLMSPEGPIPPQYQQGSQYDTKWIHPYIAEYSPPSAPDSGPTTPEYYATNWAFPQAPQSYARANWNANAVPFTSQRGTFSSGYNTSYAAQPFTHLGWAGHGTNCGCTLCSKHSDYYFNHSGYPIQSVMG